MSSHSVWPEYDERTQAMVDAMVEAEDRALAARKEELEEGLLPEVPFEDEPTLEELVANNPIGDPETVAERIVEEVRRVGSFHMSLYMHVGSMPLEKSMRSIERFAAEVMPLVEKELGEPVTAAAAE